MNQSRGRAWVAAQRGHVSFQYRYDRQTQKHDVPFVPSLFVDLLGGDFFNPVRGVVLDCDVITDFKPITDLQSLETLMVNIDMVENIDFSPLEKLPSLRILHFTEHTILTKRQLKTLQQRLPNTKVTSKAHPRNDG